MHDTPFMKSRDTSLSTESEDTRRLHLLTQLRAIVGDRHVLTDDAKTRRYRKGFRFGDGPAAAVLRPGSLLEMWDVLNACARERVIVIMQASNTGLTGGSTPDGGNYDRDVVIISTRRLAKVHILRSGEQVLCLPGATLFQLEKALKPLGRLPHSVIGSSCIGASVFGGVCNNSGGALIHRGPAFTQMALYARIDESGRVALVNHLGVELGDDPETILRRCEAGQFTADEVRDPNDRHCSDHEYQAHVRDIEADTPARFNADPRRLFEASGSAGKVMALAVRLDTFPKDETTATFYVGTNDPDELENIRRTMLATFKTLPLQAEYLHRDAFDIAEKYGKDTFLAIRHLGTDAMPRLFSIKGRIDAILERIKIAPRNLSDRIMQAIAGIFPRHLPKRLYDYRDKYAHHLMIKAADDGIDEVRTFLADTFPTEDGNFFECSPSEGEKAFLHRFAAAGAAIRYRAIHGPEVEDIVALDIALRRNDTQWFEQLPPEIDSKILHKLYYGHFFCHVLHQDYIVRRGVNTLDLEHAMWTLLDERGAEYPAEHNVGHLYKAKPALADHYRTLDPSNSFNAGIGQTSKLRNWQ